MSKDNIGEMNRRNLDFVVGFSKGKGVEFLDLVFGSYGNRWDVFLRSRSFAGERYGFDRALETALNGEGVESELRSIREHSTDGKVLVNSVRRIYWPQGACVMDVNYSQTGA